MTNRTTKKLKKPLETTLGRAPSTHNNEVDLSHVRQPIETSVFGIREVLKLFETGTDEVKNYVMFECDIMYECRTCRTIFRSLANFILHKRNYCKEKFCPVDYFNNSRNKEPFQTVLKDSLVPKSPEPVKKTLSPIIEKLLEKQKVVQLAQRALSEDLSKTSSTASSNTSSPQSSGEAKRNGDAKVVLEQIESTNAAMFQTMLMSVPSFENDEEFIKNEVMEIHGIFDNDLAVLGPDGKISLFETNTTRRNNPFYMRNNLFCTECQLTFITKKTLEYHIRTKHNNTRIIYHCPSCKLPLATPWSVCRHLLKVHKMSNKQVRRMREQIHNSQVRKDQEPAVKKKNNEAERSQESTDEENQWLNNLEGDNDLQMCGGCGKRFERKAALFSHSQLCAKRIAVCNAIKENNAKKKEEEHAERVKTVKSEKQTTNVVLTGSQKRKPQFCRAYERKPDNAESLTNKYDPICYIKDEPGKEIPESNTDATKKSPNIETVYLLQSKGSDSPLSFKGDEQIDPLGINKEVPATSENTTKSGTKLDEMKSSSSNYNGKDMFKEDLINNDVDFDTFCDKMGGRVKQNTVDCTGSKILNNSSATTTTTTSKKFGRHLQNTKSSAERCHRRLRSRDVIVEDDDIIFVGEEPKQDSSVEPQITSTVDNKSDLPKNAVPNSDNQTKTKKTYQVIDEESAFVGFSSEEQNSGRASKINGLCHLGLELDQDLSTLSYNNPLKRKREGMLNDRRAIAEVKTSDMKDVSSKRRSSTDDNAVTIDVQDVSSSKLTAESSKESRLEHQKTEPPTETESLEMSSTEQCDSSEKPDTLKEALVNDILDVKDDDEDLEVIFSSFQNGNIGASQMYGKPSFRRRRGMSIDHRLAAKDAEKTDKWGETFISKATQYMDQEKLLCVPCNITYNSLALLLWHMSAHFSWFRFQCSKCSFVSFNKFDCVKHAKEAHNLKSGDANSDVDVFLPIPHWKTVLMAHDFQPLVDSDGLSGKHTDEVIVEQNFVDDDLKLAEYRVLKKRDSGDIEGVSLFSELSKSDTECSSSSLSNPPTSPRAKRCRKTDKIDIEDNSSDLQKIDNMPELDLLMTMNVSDIIKRAVNDEKYRDSLNLDDEEDCCSSSKSSSYGGDVKSSNEDVSDREFYDYPEECQVATKDKDDSIRSVEYNMVVEMVDYSNDKTERSSDQGEEENQFMKSCELSNPAGSPSIDDDQPVIDEDRIEEVEEIILRVSENDDGSSRDDAFNVTLSDYSDTENIVDSDSDIEEDVTLKAQECEDDLSEDRDVEDGCEKITIIQEVASNTVVGNNSSSDSEQSDGDIEDDGKELLKTVPVRVRPARNRFTTLQKDFYYDLGRAVKLNETGAAVSSKSNNVNKKKHVKSSNKVASALQSYRHTYPAKKK